MPMVQLGLTFSMIGLAAGQLLFGPLSDKYGRRPLLLVSMAVFILSTIGCIFSPTIHWFVALRLLQGIGASGGIVISRSVAADKFSGRELAKAMAIIGAINGIAPVAAPVAGGFFTDIIGWQGIFIILLCIGFILLAAEMAYRETLPAARRSDEGLKRLALNFGKVLGNKKFLFYVLQFGCASGVLFGNIASSPFYYAAALWLLSACLQRVFCRQFGRYRHCRGVVGQVPSHGERHVLRESADGGVLCR